MEKVILTTDIITLDTTTKVIQLTSQELNATLREKFLAGIVHFTFQKKDGSLREAFGTLHPEKIIIPEGGQKVNENPTIGTYFDIEANAWRSYTIANLIAIY